MIVRILIMVFGALAAGVVLGQLQIYIMGANGWAMGLTGSTVVSTNAVLDWVIAGRPLTSYHAWLIGFLLMMVHFPFALLGAWNLKLEARALGSMVLIWTMADIWWFVANPAVGWEGVNAQRANWISHWFLGLPVDWLTLPVVAIALIAWSYALGIQKETKPVETEESLNPPR